MNGWTIPGDPSRVEELSNHYRATCTLIGEANDTLRRLASSGDWSTWTGGAAEAFAGKLGALPGMLDQAWASYNHAAWTLWEYGNGLAELQGQLGTLLSKLRDAQDNLASLQASQQLAQHHGVDTSSFAGPLSNAHSSIDTLVAQLDRLCQETFPALVAQCVARLREAEHLGISNNLQSDYQLYISDDAASFIWQVATGVVKLLYDIVLRPLIELPGAILNFIQDPSWEHLSTVLGDLASVLALLMLVVPGLGEAALAAWALGGLDVGAMATQTAAVITHEKGASWEAVALDGVAVATDGLAVVSGAAHAGAKAGDTAVEDLWRQSETATRYAKSAEAMGLDATHFEEMAGKRASAWLDALAGAREEDSASKLFRDAWRENVTKPADNLMHAAGELPGRLVHSAQELPGTLAHSAQELPGTLAHSAEELSGRLAHSAQELPGRLAHSAQELPGSLRGAAHELHTVASGTLGDLRGIAQDPLGAARDAGSSLWHSDPVTRMLTEGVPPDALHSPGAVRLYQLRYRVNLTSMAVGSGGNATKALTGS